MGTVKIGCRMINGVALRLFKKGFDDGTGDGVQPTVSDGPLVRLRGPHPVHAGAGDTSALHCEPVINEVDAEFWAKWAEQNAANPIFAQGYVYAIEGEA